MTVPAAPFVLLCECSVGSSRRGQHRGTRWVCICLATPPAFCNTSGICRIGIDIGPCIPPHDATTGNDKRVRGRLGCVILSTGAIKATAVFYQRQLQEQSAGPRAMAPSDAYMAVHFCGCTLALATAQMCTPSCKCRAVGPGNC